MCESGQRVQLFNRAACVVSEVCLSETSSKCDFSNGQREEEFVTMVMLHDISDVPTVQDMC